MGPSSPPASPSPFPPLIVREKGPDPHFTLQQSKVGVRQAALAMKGEVPEEGVSERLILPRR